MNSFFLPHLLMSASHRLNPVGILGFLGCPGLDNSLPGYSRISGTCPGRQSYKFDLSEQGGTCRRSISPEILLFFPKAKQKRGDPGGEKRQLCLRQLHKTSSWKSPLRDKAWFKGEPTGPASSQELREKHPDCPGLVSWFVYFEFSRAKEDFQAPCPI